MAYQTILLFGPPGSGKGTWGDILGKVPGFSHVSTGDMFRKLAPTSEVGQLAPSYIRKGELVPDEHTVALWREYMQTLIASGDFKPDEQRLVLDGLPRTRAQARMVKDDLGVVLILFLDCPDRDILVRRLQGRAVVEGREDDANEEVIRNRFRVYEQQTGETLAHYPERLIQTVDVSQVAYKVLMDIGQVLVKRLGVR